MKNNPRDDIRKIIEWHVMCTQDEYQVLPCNFVPLIVGPSGSGKTYTIKSAIYEYEKLLNAERRPKDPEIYIPFIEVDATQLTAENWNGQSISQAIFEGCVEPQHAEQAVVYIDEIDKIAMRGDKNHNEVNRHIQSNLLKWLDPGSICYLTDSRGRKWEVSNAQMTFIFSGAFESLYMEKSIDNKQLGFNADIEFNNKVNYNQEINWEDIKKSGLMPELVNRMNIMIQTYSYSDAEMKTIINKSYDKNFIEQMLGVKIPASRALRNTKQFKAGARGMHKALYQEALDRYKLKN